MGDSTLSSEGDTPSASTLVPHIVMHCDGVASPSHPSSSPPPPLNSIPQGCSSPGTWHAGAAIAKESSPWHQHCHYPSLPCCSWLLQS